jgi:energy-coupling factor transporter ATP-binding protein EcfA2
MSTWDTYPDDYRFQEVQTILSAVQAGECVAVVGLSGSGKSNLLGFIANRVGQAQPQANRLPAFYMVDCNRLVDFTPQALFRLMSSSLTKIEATSGEDALAELEESIDQKIADEKQVCLLFDRFDAFMHAPVEDRDRLRVAANLRALRDTHKYDLTFVLGTRRPLDPHTELAELFFAHTLWLGPLAEKDARWNISRYAQRKGLEWDEEVVQAILKISWGYPSILRAACEAYAEGCELEIQPLLEHPAICRRVDEFWADQPKADDLRLSRLTNHPILSTARDATAFDTTQLTAKENLLWEYFLAHPEQVCEKDDLIRAVWPEDRIFERGIRDDSLAQLIRRLREKVEPEPANPLHIHTVPGRGYRFSP